MTPVALRSVLSGLILLIAASGCIFTKESRYPVNAGDSTPISEREDDDAYARIIDRTPIVAFEYGRCESDADCMPRGCDNAVCSPEGFASTCVTDEISACLATVPSTQCGCTDEGVCRWTRNTQVMQCARKANDVSETRAYTGAEGESYPWRPFY